MGVVIRQSVLSSLSGYLGVLIGFVNTVILMPYFMDPEEIGLFRTTVSIAMLVAPLVMAGMTGTIIKFYPEIKENHKTESAFQGLTIIIVLSSFALVCSFLLVFKTYLFNYFRSNAPEVNEYLGSILLFLLFIALFNLLEVHLRALLNTLTASLLRDAVYKLFTSVALILFGYGLLSIRLFIQYHIITYVILVLIMGWVLLSKYNFKPKFNLYLLKTELLSRIRVFASFSLISGIGTSMIMLIDQIMISSYLGLTATGIYTTSVFMAIVIELPKRFVHNLSMPILSEYFYKGEHQRINTYYKGVSINLFIFGSFLFLLICNNLTTVYELMPSGEKFSSGYWVVITFGFAKLVDMLFSVNGPIIMVSKYYRLNMIMVALLGVVTVLSNLLLIPHLGINGAALASFLSVLIFNLAKFILVWRITGFHPFSKQTAYGLLILSIGFLAGLLPINTPYLLTDLAVRTIIIVLLYFVWIVIFKPSEQIEAIWNQIKLRFINRK